MESGLEVRDGRSGPVGGNRAFAARADGAVSIAADIATLTFSKRNPFT